MKKGQIYAAIFCFVSVGAIGLSIALNGWSGLLALVAALCAAGYMYWAMDDEGI